MPLDTFIPGDDDLNIDTLVLDRPECGECECAFDPRFDITDADWEWLIQRLSLDRDIDQITYAVYTTLLQVPGRSQYCQGSRRGVRDYAVHRFWEAINASTDEWDTACSYAAKIKIVFPESLSGLDISRTLLPRMMEKAENPGWVWMHPREKILFPHIPLHDLHRLWDTKKSLFNVFAYQGPAAAMGACARGAELRIFFPERFPSLIDDSAWDNFRQQLQEFRRQGSYMQFAKLAKNMAVIGARDIILTPERMQLVFSENPEDPPIPPMPQLLHF